jgi:glycosyltransferase involved in cell wall biosynthesis
MILSEKMLQNLSIAIVLPVFNDWQSLRLLLSAMDETCHASGITIDVYAVNDGSTIDPDLSNADTNGFRCIRSVHIIHLTRNFGHQRAIAIGLCHAAEHAKVDAVVVMDSDGEDKPEDILTLAKASMDARGKVIFAQRAKRSESLSFRFFYIIYKRVYKMLTGSAISFGNFSIIPASLMQKATAVSEIWIHYAAGVMKSRLPIETIPTERGTRLAGQSKMNFVSLLLHGLSGIAVHLEVVAARMLVWSLIFIGFSILGIGIVFSLRLLTNLVISGWASGVTIGLLGILLQALLFSTLLVFLVLNNRTQQFFVPRLNYTQYIQRVEEI